MTDRGIVTDAIQANKDHQYALRVYTERLENELKTVDKLIAAIESDDELDDSTDNGLIAVEGAVRPISLITARQLLSEDSPFHEDAAWKKRYDDFTTVNQMRAKEHEALRDAIRIENIRMCTLDAQRRQQTFDVQSFSPDYFERNTEGIDWKRVSVKMNAAIPSGTTRTARECEIRWLGHLHPSLNQSTWSTEEIKQVKAIVAEMESQFPGEPIKWELVAKKLGTNRTAIDCMRNGMPREVHTWTPDSDRKLLEAVSLFGMNNWQLVAMNVSEYATAHQCQKRYFDTLDPNLKSGPWSSEEDEKLLRAISAFSGIPNPLSPGEVTSTLTSSSSKVQIPWQEVSQFVPGRNNNQCRERYQDRLMRPRTKSRPTKSVVQTVRKGKEKAISTEEGDTCSTDDIEMNMDATSVDPAATSREASKDVNKVKPKPRLKTKGGTEIGVEQREGEVYRDENNLVNSMVNNAVGESEARVFASYTTSSAGRGRKKGPNAGGRNTNKKRNKGGVSSIEGGNSILDQQTNNVILNNSPKNELTKKRKLESTDVSTSERDQTEAQVEPTDTRRRSSRLASSRT